MLLEKTRQKMAKNGVPLDTESTFAQLTTFRTGGKILLTLRPTKVAQLCWIAKYLFKHKIRHVFLGFGSNVLAADKDFDGVVVVTTGVDDVYLDGQYVVASCGVSTARLSAQLQQNGLTGGEFFGCIPATVGGATVCNAGCFGQEISQVVQSVTVLHKGKVKEIPAKKCNFAHRTSLFKNNPDYVILQVSMRFPRSSMTQVKQNLQYMRDKKSSTQPLGAHSAGCVLYSDKVAVSRLTDQAGLKGFRLGGAVVSEKHAGFVINLDKATSRDIYLLIEHIKNMLKEKFGVEARTELCLINFD